MANGEQQYNSDELTAPEWLNDQFFRDILRAAQNDSSIEITQPCELRPGTAAGDHYASVMYRTSVHYRSKQHPAKNEEQIMHLIMKTIPTGGGVKMELLKDNSLFKTEIKMYTEVLPAMSKVLSSVGYSFESPRLIHASIEPNTIIIFEDLAPQGWIPGHELIGSLEEALPTIHNIARFHAASYYLHPTLMDLSTNSAYILSEESSIFMSFFQKGFDDFCNQVVTWDDCKQFANKFPKLRSTLEEKLKDVYRPNPNSVSYNVLNHGDFHWKNLLHKKNADGRIVSSMLIDFQCCNWSSPATDVLSLVDLIVDHETKMNHRNEIVFEYHRHFAEILGKLGCSGNIPSLVDLQIELLRKGFLEVMHVTIFEPFKHVKLTETMLDDVMAGNNPMFANKQYRKVMQEELPSLMYLGLLD